MMMKCSNLLLMTSCILLKTHPIQTNTCKDILTSFSISTQRNNSGHWYYEVSVDLNADNTMDDESKQTGQWNLGVSFGQRRCDVKESMQIVAAISVPPPKPGPGYELFPGFGYYKFHTTIKTWIDARKMCASEGAHLLILNSDAEANIAKQLFSRHRGLSDWAFIGFHDHTTEGEYITIFGEPLEATGYTKWGKGQPDNYKDNEDCGSINIEGALNDLYCDGKVPFICELELQ